MKNCQKLVPIKLLDKIIVNYWKLLSEETSRLRRREDTYLCKKKRMTRQNICVHLCNLWGEKTLPKVKSILFETNPCEKDCLHQCSSLQSEGQETAPKVKKYPPKRIFLSFFYRYVN